MSAASRRAVLGSGALALASARLATRLLAPRERLPEPLPVALEDFFSAEEVARGTRYARPQYALGLTGGAARLALLVGLTAAARRRTPRRRPGRSVRPPHATTRTAAAAAVLAFGETAVGLPTAAIARRRSIAVGLSTQSWRGWGVDLAKSVAIEAALVAGGGAVLAELGRRRPGRWWAPAAAGSVLFGTALGALAPVVLDPLFNDFTPLPDGALRADVLALAAAAGVRVGEVYSVDASRRTTAANAYVTGLGPTKRVVLFDTLLDRHGAAEIRTVVAHELAHVRHRDVLRSVVLGAIVTGPLVLAVERLAEALHPAPTSAGGVPAVALALAVVAAPVGALGSGLSRAVERRADAFAVRLSGAPEAFVAFERAIALQNVADLDPPRWVARLSSHPPTAERIGAALAAAATAPARPRTRAGS